MCEKDRQIQEMRRVGVLIYRWVGTKQVHRVSGLDHEGELEAYRCFECDCEWDENGEITFDGRMG